MSFQTTVIDDLRSGVIGEIAYDGPTRAQPAILDSGAGAANNVIGRVFTWQDKEAGTVRAGGPVMDFAGVLILPKTHALRGVVGDTLAESLTLPDGVAVELLYMGSVFVSLADEGDIRNEVIYDTTTGELTVGIPGAGQATVPGARLARHNSSPTAANAYLAVLELTN